MEAVVVLVVWYAILIVAVYLFISAARRQRQELLESLPPAQPSSLPIPEVRSAETPAGPISSESSSSIPAPVLLQLAFQKAVDEEKWLFEVEDSPYMKSSDADQPPANEKLAKLDPCKLTERELQGVLKLAVATGEPELTFPVSRMPSFIIQEKPFWPGKVYIDSPLPNGEWPSVSAQHSPPGKDDYSTFWPAQEWFDKCAMELEPENAYFSFKVFATPTSMRMTNVPEGLLKSISTYLRSDSLALANSTNLA